MEDAGTKSLKWKKPTCWTKRMYLAVAVIAVMLLIIIVLSVALARRDKSRVCLTHECVKTAANMLDNMDTTVNPCSDFYEFSCGNFMKRMKIPDEKHSISTINVLNEELEDKLAAIVEQDSDSESFNKAKQYYRLCTNTTKIEEDGLKPVMNYLKMIGGWPVLMGKSWDDSNFSWTEACYKMKPIGRGNNIFVTTSITRDLKNSTVKRLAVDETSLGLTRDLLVEGMTNNLVKAYYDYMVDLAVIMGADKDVASNELKESLEFEIALANLTLPIEETRNLTLTYNPMTVKQMQNKFKSIMWIEFLNRIYSPYVKIGEDELIIVSNPTYLTDFEKLIAKTPRRVVANYIAWRIVQFSAFYLTNDIRMRKLTYLTAISGQTKYENRNRECITAVSNSFAMVIGAEFVKKHFHPRAKENALKLVNDIRSIFNNILEHVDWLDDKTRAYALDKAKSMKSYIGYPDELMDDKKIQEYYEDLDMNADSYLDANSRTYRFDEVRVQKEFRMPTNKTDWRQHNKAAVINAFYSPLDNGIDFPAGILQGIFFQNDGPEYINYGAIGFVIGHEITHGFDDQGRQFDKNGKLFDWWEKKTKERYLERAQCIVDQYSNFTAPETDTRINGKNTQGENIADNGGIKMAYLAYSKWAAKSGPEPSLPGLNYNPKQLFWISAANVWCTKYRPETLKMSLLSDSHSPARFRVNGPISNMEEFGKDFNCPIGSKMNPTEKCKVW